MPRTDRKITHRVAGLALMAAVAAMFATALGTAFATPGNTPRATPDQCGQNLPECHHIGITEGWYEGRTVDFQYTRRFFCAEPPESGAPSECEAGEEGEVDPPSGFEVTPIYVLVPLGFSVPTDTLQCPVVGDCIDHPRRIDLSRVFGAGSESVLLPAHSHAIEDEEEFISAWWPVEVIGVTTPAAWNEIVKAKSMDEVRRQQRRGHATDDIETNVYLFFEVLKG